MYRIPLVFFAVAAPLLAQATDGNILGTVFDASGANVAGAVVELVNVATGIKATATTDGQGAYRYRRPR